MTDTLTTGPDTLVFGPDTLTTGADVAAAFVPPSPRGWIGSPFAVYPFAATAPASMAPPPVPSDLTALYIDPRTRDHVLQGDGELARMPTVRQQMLVALMTVVESMSTDLRFGIDLPETIDETFPRRMRNAVELACQHITRPKRARVTSVETDIDSVPGRAIPTVSFIDLTTGQPDQISPPL